MGQKEKIHVNRLQVELTDSENELFQELMQITESRTQKELVANLLTLGSWACQERQQGNVVISRNPRSLEISRLAMPFLEKIRPKEN